MSPSVGPLLKCKKAQLHPQNTSFGPFNRPAGAISLAHRHTAVFPGYGRADDDFEGGTFLLHAAHEPERRTASTLLGINVWGLAVHRRGLPPVGVGRGHPRPPVPCVGAGAIEPSGPCTLASCSPSRGRIGTESCASCGGSYWPTLSVTLCYTKLSPLPGSACRSLLPANGQTSTPATRRDTSRYTARRVNPSPSPRCCHHG